GNIYFIDFAKTLTADLTICGTLRILTDGALSVVGEFIEVCNNGDVFLLDGSITISGGGTFNNGCCSDCCTRGIGRVILQGGSVDVINGSFVNSLISSATGIVIVQDGIFDVSGGVFVNGFDDTSTGSVEIEGGSFGLSGGTLYNGFGATSIGSILHTGGTLSLDDGILYSAYGASSQGALRAQSGTLSLGQASMVKGDGTNVVSLFGAAPDAGIQIGSDEYYMYNGHMVLQDGQTMTIPSNGQLSLERDSVLSLYGDLVNNGTLSQLGTIYLFGDSTFTNNNQHTGYGAVIEMTGEVIFVQEGYRGIIPGDMDLVIPEWQRLIVEGEYINRSGDSLNIYGSVYTFSILKNGDISGPGSLTVHYPGMLALLGGTLDNYSTSTVTINSGGSLYNYYGIVDNDGLLHVDEGAQFDSARGSIIGQTTIDAGSIFTDLTQVTLDRDLDLDATWTITIAA
ncbi:unnamed protein product, partial [marine sediment metagenome]